LDEISSKKQGVKNLESLVFFVYEALGPKVLKNNCKKTLSNELAKTVIAEEKPVFIGKLMNNLGGEIVKSIVEKYLEKKKIRVVNSENIPSLLMKRSRNPHNNEEEMILKNHFNRSEEYKNLFEEATTVLPSVCSSPLRAPLQKRDSFKNSLFSKENIDLCMIEKEFSDHFFTLDQKRM